MKNVQAIQAINGQRMKFINSRRGQQVITNQQYTLQSKLISKITNNGLQTKNSSENLHENFLILAPKVTIQNINDIIELWVYEGEPLANEKIVFGSFIDLRLRTFQDLIRIHKDYEKLIEKYSRLLTDQPESRAAAKELQRNMESLEISIKEIHENTLDVVDDVEGNDVMTSFMKGLSREMKKSRTNIPGTYSHDDKIFEEKKEIDTDMEIDDYDLSNCMRTILNDDSKIRALEVFCLNNKQFTAIAQDRTIKLWDLTNNRVSATLIGHKDSISALTLYSKNGMQMIASGDCDGTIKLWDLSNNLLVKTITGHKNWISSLVTFEKGSKMFLASGCDNNAIMVWDLDDYNLITILEDNENYDEALTAFHRDFKPQLVPDGLNKPIQIDYISDCTFVPKIDENIFHILSFLLIDHQGRKMLARSDLDGAVKIWDLENHKSIRALKGNSEWGTALEVIYFDEKVCLASVGCDHTIRIWDLESKTVMATFNNNKRKHSSNRFNNISRNTYSSNAFNSISHNSYLKNFENESLGLWIE